MNSSEGEEYFQLLLNSLPNLIWTATVEGKIAWYKNNDASWMLTLHPDDIKFVSEAWHDSIHEEIPFKEELRFREILTGEYRWHLSLANPIKDRDGKVFKWIGSCTDIHEQKTANNILMEERDLIEAFVSSFSHDLRTPLTVAKLSSQTLEKKLKDSPVLMRAAHRISINMDRANHMLEDLLDASLIRAGETLPLKIGHCCLNQLLENIIDELSSIYGERFKIQSMCEVNGYWDISGLRRIFENLMINGMKYGLLDTNITILLVANDSMVEIKVHNEGKKLIDKELISLFVPFKRLEAAKISQQKGWGIGLTLVKGITEAHGGTVEASSVENFGTTFTVIIPLDSRSYII